MTNMRYDFGIVAQQYLVSQRVTHKNGARDVTTEERRFAAAVWRQQPVPDREATQPSA